MTSAHNEAKDPPVLSDTSEAASVKTSEVELKSAETTTEIDAKPQKEKNLNDLWKDLDAMYVHDQ